jgi:predicted GNAT family N-acyltransferase
MDARPTRDQSEVDQALALRERVFCGEQGVSLAAERDGRDADATHVVVVEGGRVIGTARLLLGRRVVRLSRLAVDPAFRRRGVARAVLESAERCAREVAATRITLHAQIPATALYEGAGYRERGERFIEEGIEHVVMEKALA